MPRPERNCARCKVDASPRWWKLEDTLPRAPTHVDSHAKLNGIELNGHVVTEQKPSIENTNMPNGAADHPMGDAPSAVTSKSPSRLHLDTNFMTASSPSYLCQKCHWKKEHGINEDEDRERSKSVLPEPQQLPLRSPIQAFVAPPPPASLTPWGVPGGPPALPPNQPPPLPAWHSAGPPGPPATSHPPHHLQNGIGFPAPPHAAGGHHAPFHAAYPSPNGFPSHTAGAVHPQMPPAPMRAPYPPTSTGPPPPLHLNNNGIMVNGVHSPRNMPYSPTHPHEFHSSRSTESPFAAPPPSVPHYALHHGSPASGRPETPRDTVMREAPLVTSAPTERANTGASASPSLRNLLH